LSVAETIRKRKATVFFFFGFARTRKNSRRPPILASFPVNDL